MLTRSLAGLGLGCLLLLSPLAGCSALVKEPPLDPWYFSAAPGATELAPASVAQPDSGSRLKLNLRRVEGSAHLRENLAWRRGQRFGYHEERRWTQTPAAYLRLAAERALFGSGATQRVLGYKGAVLELTLTAFEEAEGHAEVRVTAFLHRDDRSLLWTTLSERTELAAVPDSLGSGEEAELKAGASAVELDALSSSQQRELLRGLRLAGGLRQALAKVVGKLRAQVLEASRSASAK